MIRKSYHVTCAFDRCRTRVGQGQLFCEDHYFSLPRTLRDRLWTAWRSAIEARHLSDQAQEFAHAEYYAAYDACREYLRHAPTTDAATISTIALTNGGAEVRFVDGRAL